ncbi:MAG TPA: hypothetical protein VJR02_23610 [Pyrinomonadaceae bacterium]|nr:hypothetical protein [Pyrinomonadaceae bacterium]
MSKFRMILVSTITVLLSCPSVYCQVLTEDEKMQWFVVRLPFWAVYGLIVGTIVSVAWLRRVKYIPENLSIDNKVRRRFVAALLLSLLVFEMTVWLDFWLFYSFETVLQGPIEALSETWRSWQAILLIGLASVMFYAASFFWTRGAFSGRYALWPGPKRQ